MLYSKVNEPYGINVDGGSEIKSKVEKIVEKIDDEKGKTELGGKLTPKKKKAKRKAWKELQLLIYERKYGPHIENIDRELYHKFEANALVQVKGEKVFQRIHSKTPESTAAPPPPATLVALPSEPSSQGASSSTIIPSPAPTDPSSTTSILRAPIGTIHLTRENFVSLQTRLEREERQQTRLIDELPTFLVKVVEKALKPWRDSLLVTYHIMLDKVEAIEAMMAQIEKGSEHIEIMSL
ncbi:hypothetical protein HAX54_040611 [Datura stramonium]|uniref:Uncharacterized protein n=1 Tax=Datura stramonium TaxID=4076 RepID=A0ABS8SKI8_DATST|nr:hypothetical protein [Datura stramonium]